MQYGKTRADTPSAEAIVVGAGPAGLTTAVALGAMGLDVLIAAPAYDPARAQADQRTTALLPSSIQLLENLGVWGACAHLAAPLEGVRIVDDRGGLLRAPEVLFRAQELGLASLGANIPNAALNGALDTAAGTASRLRRLATSAVVGMAVGPECVDLVLAEGGKARGRLAVAADGRNSIVRAAAGIGVSTWTYDQAAIAAVFRHSGSHANITTEFHRRAGPLTVVPLPGDASSLVWVETAAQARRLAALDDAAFLAELSERLQGLLGQLRELGPRATFPLAGLNAQSMARRRTALVGEAAHAIPPIGAQGLNLGLRDAASLAECVGAEHAAGRDIGADAVLEAYAAARAADVFARAVSVDLLNRSLLIDVLPVQALRGLGLHLLANAGGLRRLLMQGGLGAPGPVPRLMQPGGLGQGP
jgi:2-octaprenyl-6-methoxyphenol hydroxylase